MSRVNSSLIVKRMPWHANMTEMNHLGAALIAKPHVFEGKMNQLFTAIQYSDNPLTGYLMGESRKMVITNTEWEWSLRGASTRPLVVIENVENVANTQLGRFNLTFKLKLDENWFLAGDVITPVNGSKKYQLRIQETPTRHGNGWVYQVQLVTKDANLFLPVDLVQPGVKWGKMYAQYEEGAEQSGSTQYSLPMTLRNRLSRYRKEWSVTGDAAQEVLAIKIADSKGGVHDFWIKYAEAEFWQQWYRELEMGAWYSRSSNKVLGATGRPIYSGPGIQEQLEDSHVHYYSHLSTKLIEEYLMDVFYSRISPGKARNVKAFSGEFGILQFNRAMQDLMEKRGWIIANNNFSPINKVASAYNENAYSIGMQFTKYIMPNGASLELVHNSLYDDRNIHGEIDPVTGYPTESQRITFLDFSEGGDSSNIKMVEKQDSFKLGYVSGMQNPYGPSNAKTPMAHSGDYYEMHVQKQCGIHIEDVSRCGELILQRN
jgi:hypothetical protein